MTVTLVADGGVRQGTSGESVSVGAIATQPASGTISVVERRNGAFFQLDFTLTAARLTVTDAAGAGSSGSLKILDFAPAGIVILACRQDYTAFAEGTALTGAVGDADFVMAVGSVAADAGDGALTGTEVDIGAATATITALAGTGVGGKFSSTAAVFDGTSTATDIFLNWSGSAATIDANSTTDVTGTVTVVGVLLGDD